MRVWHVSGMSKNAFGAQSVYYYDPAPAKNIREFFPEKKSGEDEKIKKNKITAFLKTFATVLGVAVAATAALVLFGGSKIRFAEGVDEFGRKYKDKIRLKDNQILQRATYKKDSDVLQRIDDYVDGVISKKTVFTKLGAEVSRVDEFLNGVIKKRTIFADKDRHILAILKYNDKGSRSVLNIYEKDGLTVKHTHDYINNFRKTYVNKEFLTNPAVPVTA